MIWLINLFRGWLDVRISGRWPERFLNICSQHGIEFWDLKAPEAGVLIVRVRVGQYRLMRKLSADALCEAKVEAEQGVPFLVWRLRKRYMLVGVAFLFLLIVFLGSRHIWQITITGNERISETEILAALDYAGIRPGVSVSKIDIGSAEDKVLLRLDDLLWVALNITGSAIEAEVHERISGAENRRTKTACNVVAKRAGII